MPLKEQQDVQYKCPFCKGKFDSTEELHNHPCTARQAGQEQPQPTQDRSQQRPQRKPKQREQKH